MKNWLRKNPQVRTIRVAAADLNGQARGKRMPSRFAEKVVEDGTRFPMSVLNLDIWGEDIDDSPLVYETGDRDGVLKPTERGFMPMPWLDAPTALLPIWMFWLSARWSRKSPGPLINTGTMPWRIRHPCSKADRRHPKKSKQKVGRRSNVPFTDTS